MNEQQLRVRAATFLDIIDPGRVRYQRLDLMLSSVSHWAEPYSKGMEDSIQWRKINERI